MHFSEFRFKATLYCLLLGLLIVTINILFGLNLFERFVDFVHQYEEHDIDEVVLILVPLLIGLCIDLNNENHRKAQLVERERLKALKATMTTVHDINNNFLNGLLYFVSEAKESNALNTESIDTINQMIFETAERLKNLSDIKHTKESDYGSGLKGIDYLPKPDKEQ